ncbi:MAG TPA: DinB family protein [Planctomycetota bacterium]|nr:DinB family protein [Planctomycetota bacterium]
MNAVVVASQLASTPPAVRGLLTGLPDELARWRPAPGKWSLLEVLCHLADEERQDFRMRLRLVLESSEAPWPDIDPAAWPVQRAYNTREVTASLLDFERERAESLKWLGGLRHVRWEAVHHHPKLGSLAAGDLLAAWVAHDLLHLRQMVNLRLAALEAGAAPYSTRYASA